MRAAIDGQRQPYESTGPIEQKIAAGNIDRATRGDGGTMRGRDGDSPENRADVEEGREVADLAPERNRVRAVQLFRLTTEVAAQSRAVMIDHGPRTFDAKSRDTALRADIVAF